MEDKEPSKEVYQMIDDVVKDRREEGLRPAKQL